MTHSIVFVVIALVFAVGKVYLEGRLAPLDAAGDERRLGDLAFSMGCSVYDLFRAAGSIWKFSQSKIDADFKRYVLGDEVPRYVRDFIAGRLSAGNQTYQKILFSGGRPPYL